MNRITPDPHRMLRRAVRVIRKRTGIGETQARAWVAHIARQAAALIRILDDSGDPWVDELRQAADMIDPTQEDTNTKEDTQHDKPA